MENIWKFLDNLWAWGWLNEQLFLLFVVLILLAVLSVNFPYLAYGRIERSRILGAPRGWKRRGKKMRTNRVKYVEGLAVCGFTDVVETLVYHQDITRHEASAIYLKLKRLFNEAKEIHPSPERLKETISKRVGTHIEPTFPDKKVVKRSHMGAAKRVVL